MLLTAEKKGFLPLKGNISAESPDVNRGHRPPTLWAANTLGEIVIQTFGDRLFDAVQTHLWLVLARLDDAPIREK
ncbi:hypothetical protein GJ744_005244 [Endocarpon pusillum]|uniref:Uncharacterized protein n=1 Tax=Endocarpon pusillum TaxID=364733 RepID=A0A8H7DYT7_9EURO|nr:hypothetical protein GJ744_005244 [Endocarpon pusillum]